MKHVVPCKLCGLPVKDSNRLNPEKVKEHFCCNGCKMVYSMLLESDQYKDAVDFKDTDLYKKCVAAGVIPDATGANNQLSAANTNEETTSYSNPTPSSQPPISQNGLDLQTGEALTCSFSIGNMWCPACAWIVEDALRKTKGVVQASCNFSSDRGKVFYDPVKTSPDNLLKVIEKLGYSAVSLEQTSKKSIGEFVRLAVTLLLTMNIMMFSWSIYSGFIWELSKESVQLIAWPVLVMATIVLIYGGYPIHIRAIAGFRARTPGMETLISIGSLTAYLYSVFNVFEGSIHLYFDASSMLILLILIGKRLEQSARNKISAGLADFFSLAPEKVKLCTDQFPKGRYVSVKQLSKEDVFQAEQGEILAADGVIIEGEAVIDESSITGEVKPFNGAVHDQVKSGTRIVSGVIRVKALNVGAESVLGKMMAIMENSLSGKTRQTARFEGLLKFFVPGVISFSVVTFFYGLLTGLSTYDSINRGISVMVISCPCALGIAIPLALVAGVSIAGKSGILVRDFEAFERIEGMDSVIFDKTGTLTSGKMQLLDIRLFNDSSREQVMGLAYALEADSTHYIANTIKSNCAEQEIPPLLVENIFHDTNGIQGTYEGKKLRLGSRDFIGEENIVSMKGAQTDEARDQVVSEIFFSMDNQLIASMTFGDYIRAGTTELIATLRGLKQSVFLISGDSAKATRTVALATGIDVENSQGDMLPHEKAEFIRNLKKTKAKVAMVGDGINDAPAMAESDMAVAVRSGLNPGEGVAAITLMQEDPVQLLDFINLAKRVNRTVKQNLTGALVYNLIGIPIAASGMLNPIIAVTAMLFSSLSVTFNTLLMLKKEIASGPFPGNHNRIISG